MEGNIGFIPSPYPPKLPGSACFTLPKCLIWRRSLAKKVLWHIVELSQTKAKCLRALVTATLILLLSPRNPTAPNVFDRTYFIIIIIKGGTQVLLCQFMCKTIVKLFFKFKISYMDTYLRIWRFNNQTGCSN